MHQHIFKVGWLLTHSDRITTILYYIVFLPGVLLHEAAVWLAASLLKTRARPSIQLPQQEIGRLELNFIKLPTGTHPLKRAIIAGLPLLTGLLAIWLIAINAFDLATVLSIAAPGGLDDVGRAAATLLAQADSWLWFYLAFTISNTMFPNTAGEMQGWRRVVLPIAVIALTVAIGQAFAAEIGELLNSLALILSLMTVINLFMVAILGTIEALIERISGHSAAFRDGRMVTITRRQALAQSAAERRERQSSTPSAPSPQKAAPVTSLHMLKLPIPGPPGQEPVSKNMVTVVKAADPKPRVRHKDQPNRKTRPPADRVTSPPLVIPTLEVDDMEKPDSEPKPPPDRLLDAGDYAVENDALAQFSRPFVDAASDMDEEDEADEGKPTAAAAAFARPFAPAATSADESIEEGDAPKSKPKANPPTAASKPLPQNKAKAISGSSKTKAVPKPSDKAAQADDSAQDSPVEELKYEPIEDEYYEDNDGF